MDATCTECSAEAGGRCPACHHQLCPEHFSRQEHAPCRARQEHYSSEQFCYVCGEPVAPAQWSISLAEHYVDDAVCRGCRRLICERHTAWKHDNEQVTRDGLRGLRYHTAQRYCHLCARVRRLGGLLGMTRSLVAIGTVIVAIALLLHH